MGCLGSPGRARSPVGVRRFILLVRYRHSGTKQGECQRREASPEVHPQPADKLYSDILLVWYRPSGTGRGKCRNKAVSLAYCSYDSYPS